MAHLTRKGPAPMSASVAPRHAAATSVASDAEPIVRLRAVEKRYGEGDSAFTALHEVSLVIPRGRTVALVGASGSGKSTLLNVLGAVDRPTTGEVTIAGQDLGRMSDAELAL